MTQTELADKMGTTQPQVVQWEKDRVPGVDQVADLERAMKLPGGYLLRAAGYVDEVRTVEDAVANDDSLLPGYRQVVLMTYETAVASSASTAERKARDSTPDETSITRRS